MRVAEFRESLAVLKAPAGEEAEPFTHFLKMETPDFSPAPADTSLAFDVKPASAPGAKSDEKWSWIGADPASEVQAIQFLDLRMDAK